MNSKLLFNIQRQTVPIYKKGSSSIGGAVASTGTSSTSAWVKSEIFPIRRIYNVGRNYREHAIEMGHNPDREPPFFFTKPADAVVICDASDTETSVPYPPMTNSLHYEGELIVAIAKDGLRIPVDRAMEHVYGYAVGCDLTRRDLQAQAKKSGRPWDSAKGFDYSCPMSPIIPKEDIDLDEKTSIELQVNGDLRQQSTIDKMIYSVPEIISNLSQLFRLRQGDLILTGTPAGVGGVNVGDRVSITCGGLLPCNFVMGDPE